MQCLKGTRRRVWVDKEENIMNDEIVQGNGWACPMSSQFREWVHDFVIHNSTDLAVPECNLINSRTYIEIHVD
jgi:hypothetical protein